MNCQTKYENYMFEITGIKPETKVYDELFQHYKQLPLIMADKMSTLLVDLKLGKNPKDINSLIIDLEYLKMTSLLSEEQLLIINDCLIILRVINE